MAYADQTMSSRKLTAIVIVGLLHAALGYAFVTGLATSVAKKVVQDLKTFDVAEEPPPPEETPPPPPPEQKFEPPPMVAPPPIVQAPISVAPTVQTVREAPVITETARGTAPSMATPARPRGNPGAWVTNDDYPSSAMREGVQGVTGFRLDIGTDGRATNCTVTASSGSALLDDTACRLLVRRARFSPAKDSSGNPMTASYSNRVRWQIPD